MSRFNFECQGSTRASNHVSNHVLVIQQSHRPHVSGSQAAKVTGVSKVLHADDPAHEKWVAENISRAVASVQVRKNSLFQQASGYTLLYCCCKKTGDLMRRVAASVHPQPYTSSDSLDVVPRSKQRWHLREGSVPKQYDTENAVVDAVPRKVVLAITSTCCTIRNKDTERSAHRRL